MFSYKACSNLSCKQTAGTASELLLYTVCATKMLSSALRAALSIHAVHSVAASVQTQCYLPHESMFNMVIKSYEKKLHLNHINVSHIHTAR